MTLRHIEIFLTLANTCNMREAAAQLFLSQPAVSSAIRELETQLGVKLFDRVGRGLRLNEKGRLLQGKLAPAYAHLNNALESMTSSDMAGHLRLGASTTFGEYILPQLLYDFRLRHPHVRISSATGNTFNIIKSVVSGAMDAGFVEGEIHNEDIRATPLFRERLILVSGDKEIAALAGCDLSKLAGYRWILREPGSGTREIFLKAIMPQGVEIKPFLELSSTQAILSLLGNKGTIACISRFIVQKQLKNKELFVIDVPEVNFERYLYRIEHKSKVPSKLLLAFYDLVSAYLNSQA